MGNNNASASVSLRMAVANWIGSALEYYDFFLFGTAAVLYLGPLFFPSSDPFLEHLTTLSSIAVGYLARPLGAVVLGYLGDRYGRRPVLCLSLGVMGTSTFLVGALPTYHDIGVAAPIALIGLRLLQGFAVSAEHSSATSLALELSPENRRGLFASLALSGTQIGVILSSTVFLILSFALTPSELMAWGWRIPFLLSAILVIVGIWVRLRLPESPAFLAEVTPDVPKFSPLKLLWSEYKTDVFRVIVAAQISVVSTIFGIFSLSWAVNLVGVRAATMLGVHISCAACSLFTVPLYATWSDRIGRKPVFLLGTTVCGILIWPYLWAVRASSEPLIFVFGLLLISAAYSAANGIWPALYGEIFSTRVRMSGMAIGTQIGFMLAAQAPSLAVFLTRNDPLDWIPVAAMVSLSCVISALTVSFFPETNRRKLHDLGHDT